jgi:Ca-activated chloride channel family protein
VSLRAPAPFAAWLCAIAPLASAQQPPVFSASSEVVRVDVVVTRDGKPVTGLGKAHFDLRDDGVRQEVEVVAGRELPLQAILVLDVSGSVAGDKLAGLKAAARWFLEGLAPADCAALVSFSHDVRLRTPACADRDATLSALDRLEALSSTTLHDAVYAALALAEPRQGRSALVVLSDGEDNTSWLSPREVQAVAAATDATVYAVAAAANRSDAQVRFLQDVARETGGRLWLLGGSLRLQEALRGVLEELRSRYVLRYQSRQPRSGWHKLEVRLNGVPGEVRARTGYQVEP